MRYNGKNYEFVRNIFGDVIRIYDGNTLVARYSYDCLDNCTVHTNVNSIATVNPFRYRGYYYDNESGLYYLMSRYYDPTVSQFLSPDTADYLDPNTIGGVDLYAYCGYNPVMYVDPTGHKTSLLFSVLCIAVMGFAAELIIPKLIDLHYSRIEKGNEYQFPENYKSVSENKQNYIMGVAANCHQFSAETYGKNEKVMTKDGRYEAIYNEEGKLVTDPRDIGTYNYCNPVTDPIGHFFADILPWILWGNSEEDSTNILQRIGDMIGIH